MDLANNLNQASAEIKTLGHVAGLIKHDILNLQSKTEQPAADAHVGQVSTKAFNPFAEVDSAGKQNMDKLLS